MESSIDWAPVFGWRVRDVAHLILGRPIEELPWKDESDANLVLFPWWNELFDIIDRYEGIDVYDVPLFNDGYGGPNPASQLGCVNAVFLGALIRIPFVYPPIRQTMSYFYAEERARKEAEEITPGDINWARRLADRWFTFEDGRFEEFSDGFDNLRKFMKDYPDFPPIIQANGNHYVYHDDIEPTCPIRHILDMGWQEEIIDKR